MAVRIQHQKAYILHTRPYSETSLLIDAFSRAYGRVSLLAKGAKRIKSKVRGLMNPFQPLLLSWSGKGELHTLTNAEVDTRLIKLRRDAWLCGCYMNELLIKLLHKHDAHEALFDHYALALERLETGLGQQIVLRIFEKRLLSEIGYGLQLDHDAKSLVPLSASQIYHYFPDGGPVLSTNQNTQSVWRVHGSTLIALDNELFSQRQEMDESKRLLRALLNHSMQGKPLKSRSVFAGVQSVK